MMGNSRLETLESGKGVRLYHRRYLSLGDTGQGPDLPFPGKPPTHMESKAESSIRVCFLNPGRVSPCPGCGVHQDAGCSSLGPHSLYLRLTTLSA